ncbi:MAG: hypothetical protein HYU87_08480, partial [Chloroflexi bacterium]|nr:hypothetical protein [Chloroflexota bacterium]
SAANYTLSFSSSSCTAGSGFDCPITLGTSTTGSVAYQESKYYQFYAYSGTTYTVTDTRQVHPGYNLVTLSYERNVKVVESPELVNTSPYEDGWLVKVKLADRSELAKLLSAGDYRSHIGDTAPSGGD